MTHTQEHLKQLFDRLKELSIKISQCEADIMNDSSIENIRRYNDLHMKKEFASAAIERLTGTKKTMPYIMPAQFIKINNQPLYIL